MTYITLDQAKAQLRIDPGLTVDDQRITDLIGAACDWAENFTNRSLSELVELKSPSDSSASPAPDPVDSPSGYGLTAIDWGGGYDWALGFADWAPAQWQRYWAVNPISQDHSKPLRRDVKQAILLYLQTLYDLNSTEFALFEKRAQDMLWPYRIALGV